MTVTHTHVYTHTHTHTYTHTHTHTSFRLKTSSTLIFVRMRDTAKHTEVYKTVLDQRFCQHNGGGFFLVCKDYWRMFDNSFPAYAFFVVVVVSGD